MTDEKWDAQVAGWNVNRFVAWYTDDIFGTVEFHKHTIDDGSDWEWASWAWEIVEPCLSNETGFSILVAGFESSSRKAMMICDAAYERLSRAKL